MAGQTHFNKGHDSPLVYPFTKEIVNGLGPTGLHSPMVGDSLGYEDPSPVSSDKWKQEMDDLKKVRYEVSARKWPEWFFEKNDVNTALSPILRHYLRLSESRPDKCADFVRMDHPFKLWDVVVEPYLLDNNCPLKSPPNHEGVPFLGVMNSRAQAHTLIDAALFRTFQVKYWYGSARPFEWSDWAEDIEMYPCPPHPEKPAGHGGFSGASQKAAETLYLIPDELVGLLVTATKQFCMFRSFSAMHIASSNLFGWHIGYDTTN